MNKRLAITILVIVLVIAGAGIAWSKYGMNTLPVAETVATSIPEQSVSEDGAKYTKTSNTTPALLTFTVPQQGAQVKAIDGVNLKWNLADPSLKQIYPNDNTYLYLQLISDKNEVVGVAGPAPSPHLSDTGTFWNIKGELIQEFYKITPGAKYKIRATLAYEPKDFTCDPAVKGECSPVYSAADQALIDKAKKYQSESGWFTISLDGYVHPTVTIDQSSLTISSGNSSIRGTATSNVTAIKVNIVKDSKYLVQTTVPVQNGKWSFAPSLPNGTYSIELWDTTSAAYFPSATFTVSK